VENPIAGAATAYIGKNIIVKMNDPGIARKKSDVFSKPEIASHTSNSVLGPQTINQ
jgi:hypothetical protein